VPDAAHRMRGREGAFKTVVADSEVPTRRHR
jgi:hypothetical protein